MNNITAKAQSIVRAAPEEVFNAFVDAEKMSKFWFTRRDNGLEEGETIFWYIGQKEDAYAIEVSVKKLVEPHLTQIEWRSGEHFTKVLWRIRETDDGGTNLTIEESGFNGSEGEIVANALDSTGGFNQVIIALKALLEHEAIINVVTDHA
ncbi:MAG: hypothetical protein [Olavius algarvensis Gamma 3 endosymbiont]|nr:hypothetical protein JY97_14325 [Alkalispirochaeta odontotermitis]CAD7846682.1 MAG: hypothetical protein [Olavius algarvensis Gamma 3 endosymbiont]